MEAILRKKAVQCHRLESLESVTVIVEMKDGAYEPVRGGGCVVEVEMMKVEFGWAPSFAICMRDIDWLSRSLGENLRNVKINVIYLSVEVVAKNQIYFRLSV